MKMIVELNGWYMYIANIIFKYRQASNIYKSHFSRQLNCWSLRCSWSIACRRCSNYIFILNLTPSFNGLGKDNYKMRREAYKFWDLVRLILEILWYIVLFLYVANRPWGALSIGMHTDFLSTYLS